MARILVGFLVTASAAGAQNVAELPYQRSYQTTKTIAAVQTCLVDGLSDLGEQTLMTMMDGAILMIREGQGPPLLIEIAPPNVKITTRSNSDVQARVGRCT